MITIIGMVIALIFGIKMLNDRHKLKIIEAKKQAQLEIDAQRYEKIREILTESIIEGHPAALEALKPLIEMIAIQMQGEDALEMKGLEYRQQLALVEAKNQPFRNWMEELSALRNVLADGDLTIGEFERSVKIITESAAKLFHVSPRTVPVDGEKKLLKK